MPLRGLVAPRARCDQRRLPGSLRRQGRTVNFRHVYRLCVEEGLSICAKAPHRKRTWCHRWHRPDIAGVNDCWAPGFMSDALSNDPIFRILTVLNCYRRGSLAIEPRNKIRAYQMTDVLDRLVRERCDPRDPPYLVSGFRRGHIVFHDVEIVTEALRSRPKYDKRCGLFALTFMTRPNHPGDC